jgi:hypothetical protein
LLTPRPARRGSTRVELAPRPRPLTPHQAGRLMRVAERNPALDVEALAVLRVLLFDFGGGRLGGCAYTLGAIAKRAKLGRATVTRRLTLLCAELAAVFRRVRRAVMVDAAAGWRGAARWCQVATLYLFAPLPEAPPARPHCEAHTEPQTTNQNSKKTQTVPLVRVSGELEAALARLGRAVTARG